MRPGLSAAAAFVFLCLPMRPADAGCFDSIGCTDRTTFAEVDLERLSCDRLWFIRNSIYRERGYCFQTDRGRDTFSNEGCVTEDVGRVALNHYERANVKAIHGVELRMCTNSAARQAPDRVETRDVQTTRPQAAPRPNPPSPPPVPEQDPNLPTGRGGTASPE